MSEDDDLTRLSDLLAAHVEAVNSGDIEAILEHFTDDVVYLGQDSDPIMGKDELEAVTRSFLMANRASFRMTSRERAVHGDLAYEWGLLTGETTGTRGGDPVRVNSTYFYLYRKGTDGRWRISHESRSDNAPES